MDLGDTPILLSCKKLLQPIEKANIKLAEIEKEIEGKSVSAINRHGLFALSLSVFEIMFADLLKYYLSNFPEKLDKNAKFQKEELLRYQFRLIDVNIEKTIISQAYKNFDEYVKYLLEILAIDTTFSLLPIDNLIEIKETRNLLLHNNLVVNQNYLFKAGKCVRASRLGERLKIETTYIQETIKYIHDFNAKLQDAINNKYSKYTRVKAIKNLWNYLFQTPILQFDDCWEVNEEHDRVEFYKLTPHRQSRLKNSLSSSELMFFGMCENDGVKSTLGSFDFSTGLQVCFWLVIFKRICDLNPPEADEPARNTAGKWLMRPRRINTPEAYKFPELEAIMDTPLSEVG